MRLTAAPLICDALKPTLSRTPHAVGLHLNRWFLPSRVDASHSSIEKSVHRGFTVSWKPRFPSECRVFEQLNNFLRTHGGIALMWYDVHADPQICLVSYRQFEWLSVMNIIQFEGLGRIMHLWWMGFPGFSHVKSYKTSVYRFADVQIYPFKLPTCLKLTPLLRCGANCRIWIWYWKGKLC